MVWYSHVLKNSPQFIVIHTVKGFGIVNKAEIDVFSGTLLLFHIILGNHHMKHNALNLILKKRFNWESVEKQEDSRVMV